MLDLQPRHLTIVRHILAEHAPDAEVWAYGSRVTGRAHEGSDLDLVLRAQESTGEPVAALHAAFADSALPFLVDVHLWHELPPSMQAEVQVRHVILQAHGTAEAPSAALAERIALPT
jgi:uncharacterized protein